MKKAISFLLFFVIALSCTACGSKATSSSNKAKESSVSVASTTSEATSLESSSHSEEDKEDLKTISVRCRADTATDENGKQRMIVDFENTGKKIFSGYILATFAGDSGILGSDVFPVKDFKPGNKGHGNVYITPDSKPDFTYEIIDYSFSDDSVSSGVEDTNMSKKLTGYMYESFGGSGKKEFAASWYSYIKKIQVYKSNNSQYSVITVSTDDEASVKNIGNAIFGNTSTDKGADGITLDEVIIQNTSGKELFRRSK